MSTNNMATQIENATKDLDKLFVETMSWYQLEFDQDEIVFDEGVQRVIPLEELSHLIISARHNIERIFGSNTVFSSQLDKISMISSCEDRGAYLTCLYGVLKAAKKDIESNSRPGTNMSLRGSESASSIVLRVLTNFQTGVDALTKRLRPEKRASGYRIEDEYDVQDLLYSMLKPLIPDLNHEVPTEKTAGDSGRVDLYSKDNGIVIEIKFGKNQKRAADLAEECRARVLLYKSYPNLRNMFFFIYDPQRHIIDRYNVQKDLTLNDVTCNGITFNVRSIVLP